MHPASFRFARGIIRTTKGSDIANLVSLEVLVFRYVARKMQYYKTCPFNCGTKKSILTGKCYKINKMYCKTLEYMVYCTENVDLTQYRAKKLAN